MKVALIHDWLVTYAGAERVLEQLLVMFPDADLFAVCDFVPEAQRAFLKGKRAKTTFIQRLPHARQWYRNYLPLMPLAIEQLDLSAYDLVVSSSTAVAKGVLVGPDQLHVSYMHTPIRYAWDLQHEYLREAGIARGPKSWLARWMLHRIRIWDARTANGVDAIVANSAYIARRIAKVYRRGSTVIYPPVDIAAFALREQKDDFYLTASRLVPYKRVDIIVEAFAQMPSRRLVVIGDGPDAAKIARLAKGKSNIQLMGYQSTPVLRDYMQRARAFVFAAQEDFGIAPVEAQACGTPVVAFAKGGAVESIRPLGTQGATGLFFSEQSPGSVVASVERLEGEGGTILPRDCRTNAERFSNERFRREMGEFVERAWAEFRSKQTHV